MKFLLTNEKLLIVVLSVLSLGVVVGAFASGAAVGYHQGVSNSETDRDEIVQEFLKTIEGDVNLPHDIRLAESLFNPMIQREMDHEFSTIGKISHIEELDNGHLRIELNLRGGETREVIISPNTKMRGHEDQIEIGNGLMIIGSPENGYIRAELVQPTKRR